MDLEILEALALADDRAPALAQLLPGSEDHDYYRAVHAQHRGALDEVDAILQGWPARHPVSRGYDRLMFRQQLYRAAAAPGSPGWDQAHDQLRDRLGVNLRHEADAEAEAGAQTRPSRLPDAAFNPVELLQRAAEADTSLREVYDEGIVELIDWQLEPARRRAMLSRLGHNPHPQLVRQIADDLAQPHAGGFATLAVHAQLTLDQLHALAALRPELRGQMAWIIAIVTRMQPPRGVDLERDLVARSAHIAALWPFIGALPAVANSLKAHVLWHWLDTDRRRGLALDRDRFRAYLALPHQLPRVVRALPTAPRTDELVQLTTELGAATGLSSQRLPHARDIELISELVRIDWQHGDAYAEWLERDWLDSQLATAQLLSGAGDPARATGVLGPEVAGKLRDAIEIQWCAHNPRDFAPDAPVALDVDLKNVGELVVKTFRIDPLAFFQIHHDAIGNHVDLDGLTASHEQVITLGEPAIRRVRRRIELPACARPGSYVIDLIGNGRASRAVIHKGRLRYTMTIAASGHVVSVIDDDGRAVPGARGLLGDREYIADDRGRFVVPFSTDPGTTPILLAAGDVATADHINLLDEDAELSLALSLDRHSLSAGRTVCAIARLALTNADHPLPLSLLREATWSLTLTDRHGVATTRTLPLELADHDASVLEWPLGDDTAEIALAIRGKLAQRSTQREVEVSAERRITIATMYSGPHTEAVYLAHTAAGWVVSVLGKTGEPRAQRPVSVMLHHRFGRHYLAYALASDDHGRIELGALPGCREIVIDFADRRYAWTLDDEVAPAQPLIVAAGDDVIVHIPASRHAGGVLARASLVEMRGDAPARHVAIQAEPLAGGLVLRGLAAGDYELRAPGLPVTPICVRARAGALAGWTVTTNAVIELPRPAPVIAALTATDHELAITVRGAGPTTRVHVIATRFVAAATEPVAQGQTRPPDRRHTVKPGVAYLLGRQLGDEYRYVLERRGQPRFPGVMLAKPGLLLNPWAREQTSNQTQAARYGSGMFGGGGAGSDGGLRGGAMAKTDASADAGASFAGYDFLPAPPAVLANLVPGADGVVRVPLAELAGATEITVITDDRAGRSLRRLALAEPALASRDLRLALALDPARHVRQHKAIAPLRAGDAVVIDDVATARLHLIDSVERAHGYLLALRDQPELREFAFVTRWHALADSERRELYSKYACHELHLFLYFKDRAFFDAVIRPHLGHKRVKTFVDHWLLDADLTPYTEPCQLTRLNAIERALLAWRMPADPAIVRQLGDEVQLVPPDPEGDGKLIDTLLGASTLDGDDELHDQLYAGELEPMMLERPAGNMPPPRPAPPPAAAAPMMPQAAPMMALSAPAPAKAKKMSSRARTVIAGSFTGASREVVIDGDDGDDSSIAALGAAERPMFRAEDKTSEWAEHNWWHQQPNDPTSRMVTANRLWRDLAAHPPGPGLLSPWLGLATRTFAEAMCALAVTDLPFVAAAHAIAQDGARLTVTAAGNALAGTSQLVDGAVVDGGPPLVVGMTYVRADDAHELVDGAYVAKYVTGAFTAGVVYTCQVVLANPTSSPQRVAALVQIPRGSLAVGGGRPTDTIDVRLAAYGTHGHEFSFYFPAPGAWSHFPAHVSRGGHIVAAAPPRVLDVHASAAASDPSAWPYLSQRAPLADVVAQLATANLAAVDLTRLAWRLRTRAGYDAILAALEARRVYEPTLWAYALLHRDAPRVRVWLRGRDDLRGAGPVLDMLDLDDEAVGRYEHLEYAPLVNARAHRLGGKLRILNAGLDRQYRAFLDLVAHRRAPTSEDLLAAAHYLLAQDRIPPALAALARVDLRAITDRVQLDYLLGYAACLTGELARAREICERWRDYPVDHWRHKLAALAALLDELGLPQVGSAAEGRRGSIDELTGAAPAVIDVRSRAEQQAEAAASQPTFDISADRDGVVIRSRNVAALELRLFEMDVELLFSRQPFMQSDTARLSYIEPGHRTPITSPPPELRVAWPANLKGKNVVVEAVGAGHRQAKVHYANDLVTTLAHQYGQLRVQRRSDGAALPATYVKVFARQAGGQVELYKDGYTDLRGWFDYATLSTTALDHVERFAILVCHDQAGAAILEAAPPAR